MLKTALAAAVLAATVVAGSAGPAAADVGFRLQFGTPVQDWRGPGWDDGWRPGWHGRDDRRQPRWHHDRRRDGCRTTLRVTNVYDHRGRLLRTIETPHTECRRTWR